MKRRCREPQRGVGLVELLVALVIGLLISVAAIGTMAHSRATAAVLGEAMRLHHDAATAMRIIEHQVRQAGARKLNNVRDGVVEFHAIDPDNLPAVLDGTQGNGTASDTLRIGLDADPSIAGHDCLGKPPEGNRIVSRFELNAGNLRCLGSGGDDSLPLIEGVEDFQVRYAVRIGDGVQYVTDPLDWSQVRGVMVCLRMVSPARSAVASRLTGCRDEAVPHDGRMRRVMVRVFNLRNARA